MAMVADALNGRSLLLLPQRDRPYCLRGVFEHVVEECRNELVFDLADCYLLLRVEEDFDSLGIQFLETEFNPQSGYRSLNSVSPWNRFMGKECGWTWMGINQQGYVDSVMLSFAGIIPNILLHVIASSIKVFSIMPVNEGSILDANGR